MTASSAPPSVDVAALLTSFCFRYLERFNVYADDDQVSLSRITEIVNRARRDLARLSVDLNQKITREKYVAYYAFWFARLGPIKWAKRPDANGTSDFEIVDINERAAIFLALNWMLTGVGLSDAAEESHYSKRDAEEVGFTLPPIPVVWQICKKRCSGICFETGATTYLYYNKFQNFEYLVRSLRDGSSTPHTLVGVLEAIAVNSCRSVQENPEKFLA